MLDSKTKQLVNRIVIMACDRVLNQLRESSEMTPEARYQAEAVMQMVKAEVNRALADN